VIISFINCKNSSTQNTTDSFKISNEKDINKSLIDSLMKVSYERGIFNGNILVAKNNGIIYQNEFGYSDASKAIKLNQNSIFNIGSIAKEFNAVAVMILKERGLLNLDDKLSNFNLQLPEWSNTISIRHLLKYTSGLPRINWKSIKNDKDIYADLRSIQDLQFEPGSDYLYSNNNVFLQSKIVEKVSGMSFNDFIRQNIIIPSNMTHTVIDPNAQNTQLVKAFNNDYVNDIPMDIELGWVSPSINDLNKWIISLHSEELITQESLTQLFDSYSKNSSSSLGKGLFENNELLIHQHHGSSFNYESFIHYDTKEDLSIILMTNNKNFKLREITESIENILNGNSFSIPQKSVYLTIRQKCYDNVNEGIELYKSLKKNYPDTYNFSNENELNRVGYKLIEKNQIEDAIKIFKLLISEFPNSPNPYDSIAEAYHLNGNNNLALLNYKKSLELNPSNSNAKNQIKKLKKRLKN
tara:strand:- start:3695 stop:5098 length:1404 start_codon:yes stop_codon:yes gene_type:complete